MHKRPATKTWVKFPTHVVPACAGTGTTPTARHAWTSTSCASSSVSCVASRWAFLPSYPHLTSCIPHLCLIRQGCPCRQVGQFDDVYRAFARFDRNASGDIDDGELSLALEALGLPATSDQVALIPWSFLHSDRLTQPAHRC